MNNTELNNKESAIHSILSGKNGQLSSKRIIGSLMMIYYMIVCSYLIITKVQLPIDTTELLKTIPWVACGLLGVSVFEKK